MVRPTVASPDPRAVPKEDDKIICHKHPSSFSDLGSKYSEKLPDISPLGIIEGGIDILSAGWGTLTGGAEYMAEGSSKVYINGQPAVRSNDRSTCEAKVTDNCKGGVRVSNNVRIGGEPIVVREIKSGKHPINLIVSVATAILRPGKLCTKIVCFGKDFFTGVALSHLTAQGTRAASTVFLGNPVHLPTGAKILTDQEELDFTIPAHF
ncbi:PAAR domain-containing protein, partial [Snodgrassella alvi]